MMIGEVKERPEFYPLVSGLSAVSPIMDIMRIAFAQPSECKQTFTGSISLSQVLGGNIRVITFQDEELSLKLH